VSGPKWFKPPCEWARVHAHGVLHNQSALLVSYTPAT